MSPLPPGQKCNTEGSEFLVLSLKRHDWLLKYTPTICKRKNMEINTIFKEEYQICKDMVELLPSKIDRMHFLGEAGLTL